MVHADGFSGVDVGPGEPDRDTEKKPTNEIGTDNPIRVDSLVYSGLVASSVQVAM